MTWYHGTSEENFQSIISSWFEPSDGIWGKGVYFSSSQEGALLFGDCILQAIIPDEYLHYIDFEEWVAKYPYEESWSEEIKKLNAKAIVIRYKSGEKELCVFDPDVIEQIYY